jgi:hypothetical protein
VKPLNLLVVDETAGSEAYLHTLPSDLPPKKRLLAAEKLAANGFKPEYQFLRIVTDRRSLSLAKAQAHSVAKRIELKTGLRMQVGHLFQVSGVVTTS